MYAPGISVVDDGKRVPASRILRRISPRREDHAVLRLVVDVLDLGSARRKLDCKAIDFTSELSPPLREYRGREQDQNDDGQQISKMHCRVPHSAFADSVNPLLGQRSMSIVSRCPTRRSRHKLACRPERDPRQSR